MDRRPSTKLEAFSSNRGRVIIRDVYPVGEVSAKSEDSVLVEAIVTYEPGGESERLKGLRIEPFVQGLGPRYESFLDIEEIPGVSKALAFMADLVIGTEESERKEVSFTTAGDFTIGFDTGSAYVSSIPLFKGRVWLESREQLNDIRKLLDSAVALLDTK